MKVTGSISQIETQIIEFDIEKINYRLKPQLIPKNNDRSRSKR